MKALFLAGGMGTRLRPLTDRLPKPLMPIMGKPLLERNLEKLKTYGIDEIILSLCHQPEMIKSDLGDGKRLGLRIQYVCEREPLGTGGAIKNAGNACQETFLIFNADILCDIDYGEMLRFHKDRRADVTIAVTKVSNPTAYGVIEYDRNGYATRFTEKPKPYEVRSNYINAGVYLFEPQVLDRIPAGKPVSVEREIFPRLLREGGKIAVYQGCNYWLDIGTPPKYMQAHRDIFAGKYPVPEANFTRHGRTIYLDPGARIHPSALITGPSYVGRGARIEAETEIGPYAFIGDNAIIGKRCSVSHSVLWGGVKAETGAHIGGSIVTPYCRVDHLLRMENGGPENLVQPVSI